jgi:hypothetical protein
VTDTEQYRREPIADIGEYPPERPLRLKSRFKGLEGEEFRVDDQGTKKVFRDCIEEEKQSLFDSGFDRFFAREQPRNYLAEDDLARLERLQQQGTDDDDQHRGVINLDDDDDER